MCHLYTLGSSSPVLFSLSLSPPPPRHPSLLAVLVSPGGSCQSRPSPRIPLELIVPAVAGGGKRSEAAESHRWRERCQSLSLIINFCHSVPVATTHSLSLSLSLSLSFSFRSVFLSSSLLSFALPASPTPRASWFCMPPWRRRVQPFIMCGTHTTLPPQVSPLDSLPCFNCILPSTPRKRLHSPIPSPPLPLSSSLSFSPSLLFLFSLFLF